MMIVIALNIFVKICHTLPIWNGWNSPRILGPKFFLFNDLPKNILRSLEISMHMMLRLKYSPPPNLDDYSVTEDLSLIRI